MPQGGGHGQARQRQRGISDGLLVGVLAFLLGISVLTWSAIGLSGLLAHGAWPRGATFTRAPLALRGLLTNPRDLSAAWPDVPSEQLPGPGLFWGIFISQLMVISVFTTLALIAVARRRAERQARRTPREVDSLSSPSYTPTTGAQRPPPTPSDTTPHTYGIEPAAGQGKNLSASVAEPHAFPATSSGSGSSKTTASDVASPNSELGLVCGRTNTHNALATEALRLATGPALLVTGNPALWSDTVGARRALGPTHLYDPFHVTSAPSRLSWSPHHGCEDINVARLRAVALLAPVRPRTHSEQAVAEAAETLLRCCLHAAAISGEPFRQVHRWAISGSPSGAVRTLRTHRAAAGGSAGELESILIAHPARRDAAALLIRRALSALSRLHVRDACTASRAETLAVESFLAERGTLFAIGKAIEDPHRSDPGTMPFLTALVSHVVEHGRRMAARSSSGRLDPPLTIILDQIAVIAPIPELPSLLADGEVIGMSTLALLRSEDQSRAWWPTMTVT